MESRKKKKDERPVFDSIRKPIAPPSRKFGKPTPEEKANPARRKTKYKKEENLQDWDELFQELLPKNRFAERLGETGNADHLSRRNYARQKSWRKNFSGQMT